MKSGTFNALFRHEFYMEYRRWLGRKWVWIYIGSLGALALAALTLWGGREGFRAEYMLYATYALPYFAFGISYQIVKREWSNGTFGWWLTLPFPRSRLMLAKFTAALAQSGLLFSVFFGAVFVLGLYNAVVHGTTTGEMRDFGIIGSQYLLTVAVVAPFMLSLGLVAGIVVRSKLKGLLPLIWVFFGVCGNALNWLNIARYSGSNGDYELSLFSSQTAPAFWIGIPVVWLVAALMLAGSVQVSKKYLVL